MGEGVVVRSDWSKVEPAQEKKAGREEEEVVVWGGHCWLKRLKTHLVVARHAHVWAARGIGGDGPHEGIASGAIARVQVIGCVRGRGGEGVR